MATVTDFPGQCLTNTYILHDFGEVAYIVCSVATPPGTAAGAQPLSSEVTVARLKNTERQFRNASILAATDSDKLQLFTFYKKVDVLRDQRSLLTKFGFVLRSNACTIAYKAATRVPDLLKQENARLHRLFVAAVLASLKLCPLDDRVARPMGSRYYVVETNSTASKLRLGAPRLWLLYRTDLQVVASGQVLLTIAANSSTALTALSDVAKDLPDLEYPTFPILLAPIGQIAVSRKGWFGSVSVADEYFLDPSASLRFHRWVEIVTKWLQSEHQVRLHENEQWIELQLPTMIAELTASSNEGQTGTEPRPTQQVLWQTFYWPTRFAFVDRASLLPFHDSQGQTDAEDPVAFAEKYFTLATKEQAPTSETGFARNQHHEDDEDDPLFHNEGAFDYPEHFQPFGPPAFPASQTVYPTPPDVIMTHATPGMSSVDGFVVTPANHPRTVSEVHTDQHSDALGTDFHGVHATGIGSGFYDEDLFEDMPGDNFGTEGAADEPNWDFFDQPNTGPDHRNMQNSEQLGNKISKRSRSPSSTTRRLSGEARSIESKNPGDDMDESVSQTLNAGDTSSKSAITTDTGASDSEVAMQESHTLLPEETAPYRNDIHVRIDANSTNTFNANNANTRRRRSSVYDGISESLKALRHDNRYSTEGDFFFNPLPELPYTNRIDQLGKWVTGVESVSSAAESGSENSVEDSDGETARNILPRDWIEYDITSPQDDGSTNGFDASEIEKAVGSNFDLLLKNITSTPNLDDFRLLCHAGRVKQVQHDNVPTIAQILVDQMSQTSLSRHWFSENNQCTESRQAQDMVVDLSNINNTTNYAAVAQLSGIKPPTANANTSGKIVKLPNWNVAVKRGEQQLLASPSILQFWDTLGIQPYSQSKNLTAICVAPKGQNNFEGCTQFLNRMADAYKSCNLGSHAMGQLTGTTHNGLIGWDTETTKESDFYQVAKWLGSAMAQSTELTGNILIYYVGRSDETIEYAKCCTAFYTLYEAYRDASSARIDRLEIVLQIVPLSFLVSSDAPVIASQQDYSRIAIEVYNRLPPVGTKNTSAAAWEYAVGISSTEDAVHFKLDTNSISPLIRTSHALHVAYSVSEDSQWLVATWTDETGDLGLTTVYNLISTSSGVGHLRQDVLRDIWEVSHDVMEKQIGPWMLIVARNGAYDLTEINEWLQIVNREDPTKQQCALHLLSIELDPRLKIIAPTAQAKQISNTAAQQANLYGTPVSTPQMTTTSPEQHIAATPTPGGTSAMNAPTPTEQAFDMNNESDLLLINPAEESWALILPFGMNQSFKELEHQPALASGYLVGRLGTKDGDGVAMIGIHVMHGLQTVPKAGPAQTDQILEDIINSYRGLATLAATRGLIDPGQNCVPWHIATAVKGSKALGEIRWT